MIGKTFCVGDIHGNYLALCQVLERSNFNEKEDTLIFLGDVCDGYNQVYECVEELLSIPNLIAIRGNHDDWFDQYIKTGTHGSQWQQGAKATQESYGTRSFMIPETHEKFFHNMLNYYIDDQNRCFVHGGFNRHEFINDQFAEYIYYWDRDLWMSALSAEARSEEHKKQYPFKIKNKFKEVFIGHTATTSWKKTEPMKACNIWNLDTGCGWSNGRLTMMNVDTHKYVQSDLSGDLYPGQQGR